MPQPTDPNNESAQDRDRHGASSDAHLPPAVRQMLAAVDDGLLGIETHISEAFADANDGCPVEFLVCLEKAMAVCDRMRRSPQLQRVDWTQIVWDIHDKARMLSISGGPPIPAGRFDAAAAFAALDALCIWIVDYQRNGCDAQSTDDMSRKTRAIALTCEHPEWSITKLAERVGIHRSTLHNSEVFLLAHKKARAMAATGKAADRRVAKDFRTEGYDVEEET